MILFKGEGFFSVFCLLEDVFLIMAEKNLMNSTVDEKEVHFLDEKPHFPSSVLLLFRYFIT